MTPIAACGPLGLGIDGKDHLALAAEQFVDTQILDMTAVGEVDVELVFIPPARGFGGEVKCADIGTPALEPVTQGVKPLRVRKPVAEANIEQRQAEGQNLDGIDAHIR